MFQINENKYYLFLNYGSNKFRSDQFIKCKNLLIWIKFWRKRYEE